MSPPIDGRRQRSIDTRTRILDAAETLFRGQGFTTTSLRTLAASIGMTHAGVLRHFANKNALLVEMLARSDAQDFAHFTDMGVYERPTRRQLEDAAEHREQNRAAIELYTTMLGLGMSPGHPARAHISNRIDRASVGVATLYGSESVDLLAGWDGLLLISLYLRDGPLPSVAAKRALDRLASPPRPRPVADVWAPLSRGAGRPMGTADEIIAAASAAFAHHGYHATRLRDVAAQLGVSHGTVLYHFPTKEKLLEGVLIARDTDIRLDWQFRAGPLEFFYGSYRRALQNEDEPDLAQLYSSLATEASNPHHPAHEFFRARYKMVIAYHQRALRQAIAEGIASPDVDPEVDALWIVALWEGLGLHSRYIDIDVPERLRVGLSSLLTVSLPPEPRRVIQRSDNEE